MKVKKILFPFIGDSIGGSHIATINLINSLDQNKFKAKILVHKKGKLSKYLDYKNIKYEQVNIKFFNYKILILNIILNVFSNLLKKIIFLKNNNISIIHCNDVRSNLIWILVSFLSRTKHIWHHHSVPNKKNYSWLFIYFLSKNIVTVSEYSKLNFPNIISSKVRVFPNIFEDRKIVFDTKSRLDFRKKYKIPQDKWVAGYIGRLATIKNLELLVCSANILINKNKLNDLLFVLIGSDEQNTKKKLRSLINLYNLRNYFIFIDHIYEIEVAICSLDCTLAPSLNDSFGRSVIEAMLLKVPVIASNLGAHKEIIIDSYNGLLFDNNSKDFCEKLETLYSNSNLKKILIKNAYNDAKMRIKLSKSKKNISRIYQ